MGRHPSEANPTFRAMRDYVDDLVRLGDAVVRTTVIDYRLLADPNASLGDKGFEVVVGIVGAAPVVGDGIQLALKGGKVASEIGSAVRHNYSYHDRVRQRSLDDPKSHNFPYSFDDEIIQNGTRIDRPNGYTIHQMRGKMNTTDGVYEIGVTKDGVIDHRFFRPD